MLKNIILLSLAVTMASCKSNKDTATNSDSTSVSKTTTTEASSTATTTTPAVVQENENVTAAKVDSSGETLYRLSVVFYSIGSGTDNKAMTAFEDFISSFATKAGKNIDYERNSWGREGETDFCLRLNELDAKSQADFVNQTKETLKEAKWVHIYENQACKHKGKR